MTIQRLSEAILASMRFVGHDDDVAPVGQHRVGIAILTGSELLQRPGLLHESAQVQSDVRGPGRFHRGHPAPFGGMGVQRCARHRPVQFVNP